MSDRGLSIFDDDPEDDLPEETADVAGDPDAERTQVMPPTTGTQPLPQRRPTMPAMDGPGEATKTQRIAPLSDEPAPERPSPRTPPPAPAGTVAEAAQVHARL